MMKIIYLPFVGWYFIGFLFFVTADKMSQLCEIIQQIIQLERQLGSEKNGARELPYNGLLYKGIIMIKGLITNHQSFSFGPVQTKMSCF